MAGFYAEFAWEGKAAQDGIAQEAAGSL